MMAKLYTIEVPDGRKIKIEADSPEIALSDADAWAAANPSGGQALAPPAPAPAAPNETSATGAFLRGAGQGIGLGGGDEAVAAAKAAYGKITGQGDFGTLYDQNLEEERRLLEKSRQEHPIAAYGGEIGGALALPMGAARLGIKGAQLTGKSLPQAARALGTENAIYGGLYGYGTSEGGIQQRLEGGAGGAALGGAVGAALPVVGRAVSPMFRQVADDADMLLNPEASGVRTVAQKYEAAVNAPKLNTPTQGRIDVLENEARMLANQGRPIPQRAVMDAGDETRRLARTAANMSDSAQGQLSAFTQDRFLGQTASARAFLQDLAGGPIDNAAEALAAKEARSSATNPLYRVAYDEGDRAIQSDVIDRIIGGSPAVRKAIEEAVPKYQERMVAEGYGGLNSKVSVTPDGQILFSRGGVGGPQAYPNLHFWDTVKQRLDAQISKLYKDGDPMAGTLTTIKNNLRDELDRLVPAYKTARETSFGFFQAKDARQAGENFLKNGARYSTNEARQAASKMTDVQRSQFRRGYLGKLMEEVERNPNKRDIANSFFRSNDDLARAEIALGAKQARELAAYFHVESVMQMAKNAVQGNSTTARQLADLALIGGGAGAGYFGSGGDPTTALMVAAVLSTGRMGTKQMMQGMRDRKAMKMAELLMGSPEQLQQAVAQIAKSPRLLDRLRNATSSISKTPRAIPGMVSGEAMAQGEQR